jgi:hypothetical protein
VSDYKQADRRIGFHFSKPHLWQFFLVTAFPVPFWAWIKWFQEYEPIAQRYGQWDALGTGGYIMVYALFESAVIFCVLILALLLLPRRLDPGQVFSVAAALYLILAGWFILEQARFLAVFSEDIWFFRRVRHLQSITTRAGAVTAFSFAVSLLLPPVLLLRSEQLRTHSLAFFSRLTVLSVLYLGVDVLAAVIVLIRNL